MHLIALKLFNLTNLSFTSIWFPSCNAPCGRDPYPSVSVLDEGVSWTEYFYFSKRVLLGVQFSYDLRWSFERFYCTSKGAFTQQFDQSLWNLEKSNETQYIPINLIKLTDNPQNSQNLGKTNKNRNTYFQALWRGSMQESLMFFVFSIFFCWDSWFCGGCVLFSKQECHLFSKE
jgi:hypothetical protein